MFHSGVSWGGCVGGGSTGAKVLVMEEWKRTSEIPFLCDRRKRTVHAMRRGFLR